MFVYQMVLSNVLVSKHKNAKSIIKHIETYLVKYHIYSIKIIMLKHKTFVIKIEEKNEDFRLKRLVQKTANKYTKLKESNKTGQFNVNQIIDQNRPK